MLQLQATPAGHLWDSTASFLVLNVSVLPSSYTKREMNIWRPFQSCQLGVPQNFTFCDSFSNKCSPQYKMAQPRDPHISRAIHITCGTC